MADTKSIFPEDSEAVKKSMALREILLAERPTEEQKKELEALGLPVIAQEEDESQMTHAAEGEIVLTNDVSTLPEGVSAARIEDGVFKVFANTTQDHPKEAKREEVRREEVREVPRLPREVEALSSR